MFVKYGHLRKLDIFHLNDILNMISTICNASVRVSQNLHKLDEIKLHCHQPLYKQI